MKELANNIDKLSKIYEQFDLLDFRCHKALPLTFNKQDSKELLHQNKRLYFSYRYLNKEKTRLTNLILNEAIDLKEPNFQTNLTLHPELIEKALKLKNIDDNHNEEKNIQPKRNRKINKLKHLIDLIADEDLALSRGYLNQMKILISSNFPALSPLREQKYQPKELLNDLTFRTDLMQFDYDRYLYEDFKTESFLKYLIYREIKRIPSFVKSFDARELIPDAYECGFSGIAYEVEIDGIRECYVTFKGTEADMDYTERSRSKRMDKYILEGYKDWDYNVNAILIGNNIDLDQMEIAREFIAYVKANIEKDCKLYGLGHSLGGHFVQTLQLIDNTFDAGYTMNSAPVQLKQIKTIKPELLSEKNWQKLFKITEDKTITKTLNNEIKKLLPREYPEIINQYFELDLTQIFYELPYTIWVGQKLEYNLNNWKYPFKTHPHQYMDIHEINSYQKFFEELFAYTKDSQSGAQVMKSTFNFAKARFKLLRENIDDPKTAKYFYDYANYLYESGIFNDKPKIVTENLSKEISGSVWKSSKREWPFLKSLNTDMLNLAIYFHIIYGSRHFMSRKPVREFK
ncbi:DUF6792 domain-containing protein [Companilactobacillus furfuricola]|uniref:DUF6792 domain-containing protein n=1 Tax=Companilactobacillus furfuricola TaxID=1462575 RepID=UPI000F7BA7F8|nr:DUF6792 domain-containing protein [Companilactobacillus furfuricola]